MMSCSSVLTLRGISPTAVRCRPAEMSAARNARPARLVVVDGRTVATSTP